MIADAGSRQVLDLRSVAPWFTTVVGATIALVGLMLPWSTQPAFDLERIGIQTGDGKVMFLVAVATGAAAISDRVRRHQVSFSCMALGAIACFALTLLELADVAGFGPGVEIGAGLWVTLAGSLVTVAGVIWRAVEV